MTSGQVTIGSVGKVISGHVTVGKVISGHVMVSGQVTGVSVISSGQVTIGAQGSKKDKFKIQA